MRLGQSFGEKLRFPPRLCARLSLSFHKTGCASANSSGKNFVFPRGFALGFPYLWIRQEALGCVKIENFVFIFPLRSALIFFGFAQDRMRLGKAKFENFVFSLGFALGFHYF